MRAMLRGVIDTNVVFEGLTRSVSVPTLIIDAWLEGLFHPCVANALAYEYVDVLSRKLSSTRWVRAQPVVEELLAQAEFVPTYFSWRPNSPDPGDEHVVDCAMNARAIVVTSNLRDFTWAQEELRLQVLTPAEFLWHLTEDDSVLSPDQNQE
jgi:predicted nucleic acid-binding protein